MDFKGSGRAQLPAFVWNTGKAPTLMCLGDAELKTWSGLTACPLVLTSRGDGAVSGLPLLATNIHRDHPHGGFTLPYITDWNQHALSLQQSMAWADCEHSRCAPGWQCHVSFFSFTWLVVSFVVSCLSILKHPCFPFLAEPCSPYQQALASATKHYSTEQPFCNSNP